MTSIKAKLYHKIEMTNKKIQEFSESQQKKNNNKVMNKINKKSLSYKRKKRERKNMFKKNNQVNKSILKYTKDNKR